MASIVEDSHDSNGLHVRLITHNIRYASTKLEKGERPWSERSELLIAGLKSASQGNPGTFICLQECLLNQLEDITRGLKQDGADWQYYGVGRDDSKHKGEHCVIFYQTNYWQLVENAFEYLSDTPNVPTKGWDAACKRLFVMGRFKRKDGKIVTVLCTHLDHRGKVARRNGALQIGSVVHFYQQRKMTPVLLAGDFNCQPGQEAYEILNLRPSPLQDAREIHPPSCRHGPEHTFTSFGLSPDRLGRIDFVFIDRASKWKPVSYAVLDNVIDGLVISDHRAVVVDVEI